MNLTTGGTITIKDEVVSTVQNKSIKKPKTEKDRGKVADNIIYFKPCVSAKYIVISFTKQYAKQITARQKMQWVENVLYRYEEYAVKCGLNLSFDSKGFNALLRIYFELNMALRRAQERGMSDIWIAETKDGRDATHSCINNELRGYEQRLKERMIKYSC